MNLRPHKPKTYDHKKEEDADFVKFIADQCENAKKPLNSTKLCNDFIQTTGYSSSLDALKHKLSKFRDGIVDNTTTPPTNTAVRQLFALGVSLDAELLKTLQMNAHVLVDDRNRIIKFTARNEWLSLEGAHGKGDNAVRIRRSGTEEEEGSPAPKKAKTREPTPKNPEENRTSSAPGSQNCAPRKPISLAPVAPKLAQNGANLTPKTHFPSKNAQNSAPPAPLAPGKTPPIAPASAPKNPIPLAPMAPKMAQNPKNPAPPAPRTSQIALASAPKSPIPLAPDAPKMAQKRASLTPKTNFSPKIPAPPAPRTPLMAPTSAPKKYILLPPGAPKMGQNGASLTPKTHFSPKKAQKAAPPAPLAPVKTPPMAPTSAPKTPVPVAPVAPKMAQNPENPAPNPSVKQMEHEVIVLDEDEEEEEQEAKPTIRRMGLVDMQNQNREKVKLENREEHVEEPPSRHLPLAAQKAFLGYIKSIIDRMELKVKPELLSNIETIREKVEKLEILGHTEGKVEILYFLHMITASASISYSNANKESPKKEEWRSLHQLVYSLQMVIELLGVPELKAAQSELDKMVKDPDNQDKKVPVVKIEVTLNMLVEVLMTV